MADDGKRGVKSKGFGSTTDVPLFLASVAEQKTETDTLKLRKNSLGHLVLQFSALTLDQTNKQNIFLMYYLKKKQKKRVCNFEAHFSFLFQFDQGGNKKCLF